VTLIFVPQSRTHDRERPCVRTRTLYRRRHQSSYSLQHVRLRQRTCEVRHRWPGIQLSHFANRCSFLCFLEPVYLKTYCTCWKKEKRKSNGGHQRVQRENEEDNDGAPCTGVGSAWLGTDWECPLSMAPPCRHGSHRGRGICAKSARSLHSVDDGGHQSGLTATSSTEAAARF